ncbi:MAG: sorbosone dehydrogenase family protein, partial [Candidatus Rokubacteria bacterium]|nr:sorbosone dehydrogenase family protein [Candidatus Rokubacteria bacterium]
MRRITVTLLSASILGAFVSMALAQQPPPAWKQGQPPEMATSPLAPIPMPPVPTPAAQIPVNQIKLPPGFTISVWATGLHNARQMAWGDKGTLFVGTRVV